MSNLIAISSLAICGGKEALKCQINALCEAGIYGVVLREKELSEAEYSRIFSEILAITQSYGTKLFLHNFADLALRLKYPYLWLPLPVLEKFYGVYGRNFAENFTELVVSVHGIDEAMKAKKFGAKSLCVSHIFATDCKKGLEPKGVETLLEIMEIFRGEIYALGGINSENFSLVLQSGADKICVMSEAMRCENAHNFVHSFVL